MVIGSSFRLSLVSLWYVPIILFLILYYSWQYWEGLGARGEGDVRGWDGWMASLTRWTRVSVNSRSWWWTGRPGVLWFMGRKESDTTERLIWSDRIWSGSSCIFPAPALWSGISSRTPDSLYWRVLWEAKIGVIGVLVLTGVSLLLGPLLDGSTAAAKSLQSCQTLCDPIDSSPPGSPVPGILQARTLEWVAISFSNAWNWKVKVKSLSRVRLLSTPWTAAYQAPLSMGFSRQEYWSGVPLPSPRWI